jgi:hypothetical protein
MNDNPAEVHTHHLAEARAHHSFVMGFFALYPLSLIPFRQTSLPNGSANQIAFRNLNNRLYHFLKYVNLRTIPLTYTIYAVYFYIGI